jgi:hypothetical protein
VTDHAISLHCIAALRGAATLKARALKDVWNVAAVIPVEKNAIAAATTGGGHHKHNAQKQQHHHRHHGNGSNTSSSFSDEVAAVDDDDDDDNNFLTICSQELLARGTELLKRTRKGNKPTYPITIDHPLIRFDDVNQSNSMIMCRSFALEGGLGLHPSDGSGKSITNICQIVFLDVSNLLAKKKVY